MDLRTNYMGMELSSPLIAGASPITHELDIARQLEDCGAAAIVMHSLFEEQLTRDQLAYHHHTTAHSDAFAEALSYFPEPQSFRLSPDRYLEQISKLKRAVDVPVIASLNGVTKGGWTHYAKLMENAGADGLELNVYYLATNAEESGAAVEKRYLEVLAEVKRTLSIPIAVKLSPFFSAPVHMAKQLDADGASALVLFNRFYQPDIDIDELDVSPALQLSSSHTLLMRLRWLAAMFGNVSCQLAASGGVHTGRDALKALMAGASAVQMTSAILREGPQRITAVRDEMVAWMEEKEYESVHQMIGSMSLQRCPDPASFERANYMKVLQSWRYGTA
jgi:dihydroorotate dehydrogenase (fumarate)